MARKTGAKVERTKKATRKRGEEDADNAAVLTSLSSPISFDPTVPWRRKPEGCAAPPSPPGGGGRQPARRRPSLNRS